MADIFDRSKRSEVMRAVKSKHTGPEMQIRRALHAKGYRYRLHAKELPGKPDLLLPKYGAAIQVRGCFWHGHACRYGRLPKTRGDFWKSKIAANKRRDAKNDRKMRRMGWRVIVVRGCRCRTQDGVAREVARIGRLLRSE